MSATSEERQAGQRDVEQALVRLLTMYSAVSRSLSEWEQYCLSSALVFERHGYFEKALIKIKRYLSPLSHYHRFPSRRQSRLMILAVTSPRLRRSRTPDANHRPSRSDTRRPPP